MPKPNFSQYEERYDLPEIGTLLYIHQEGLWGDETREILSLNCNLLPEQQKALYTITLFRNGDDVRTSETTRYHWRGKEQEILPSIPQEISDLLGDFEDFPEHIRAITCQH